MSDYLKMADVFKGVVICSHTDYEAVEELQKGDSAGSNFHLEDDGYWLATTEEHIKYAAHAINEHDSLVEQNEKIKDHLKRCADELAFMIERHNKQDMSDGSWSYDYQTPFEAHELLNNLSKGGDPT